MKDKTQVVTGKMFGWFCSVAIVFCLSAAVVSVATCEQQTSISRHKNGVVRRSKSTTTYDNYTGPKD